MAKILCIPRKFLTNLKDGIRAGDFNIAKLLEMSSQERRAQFEKHLPKELAKFANTGFEKAMVSAKKDAMVSWAEKTFIGKRSDNKNDIIDKINKLEEKGILDVKEEKNFLEDLVADEIGITLKASELQKINELAKGIEHAKDKIIEKYKVDGVEESISQIMAIDDAKKFNEGKKDFIDYFKKRDQMIKYIQGINPSPVLRVFSSTIARSFLLASFKSPLVNIVGNTAQGVATSLSRRLENKQFKGQNSDLIKRYTKFNIELFKESGYDMSRMFTIADDQRILGEKIVSSQGSGNIRAFGRFLETVVFKGSLGYADVAFSSAHFSDSSNLIAESIARKEGAKDIKARAREIMLDSMNITTNAQTGEGKAVREESLNEAFYGTFTNNSWASDITIEIRKLLNKTGDIRLGDQLIPFAKTPANVVAAAIDFSGVKLPYDVWKFTKGYKSGDKVAMRSATNSMIKAGIGIVGVIILAEMLDPEDYVSEYADYFPKEKQLIKVKGATYNSVKIGNTWISLDYFGPFGAAFVGYMNAKKYGDGLKDSVGKYYAGALKQTLKIPGVNEIRDAIGDFSKATKELTGGNYKKAVDDAMDGFADFISPRVVPALMYDMATALDDYKRRTDTKLSKFLNRIPVARETLPAKIGMFGEEEKTQPGIVPIVFGSRLKKSEESDVVDELNRLSLSNELPSISSIEYSSERIKVLKQVIGIEEFNKLMKTFGKNLYSNWNATIKNKSYQALSDEKKKQTLDKIRRRILDGVFVLYLNKYQQSK